MEQNNKNMNEVIVSCRVRLARNFKGQAFVSKLSTAQAIDNISKVYKVLKPLDKFVLFKMSDMPTLEARVLQEKRLISDELVSNKISGAAIIDENEHISVMVNEEDHLRLQCFETGLELKKAYKSLSTIDNALSRDIGYSYDDRLGYLTSCVTNVGTGMRAGALLFLPGLGMSRSIERTIGLASNFKISIRGYYGEGSENDGYFYQISNHRTLGVSEEEIVNSVTSIINHLARAELTARRMLLMQSKHELMDRVGRAYGIMTNAYTLSSKEFMEYAALVRLGHSLDIIRLKEPAKLDILIQDCQPACIMAKLNDDKNDPIERDVFRARLAAASIVKE